MESGGRERRVRDSRGENMSMAEGRGRRVLDLREEKLLVLHRENRKPFNLGSACHGIQYLRAIVNGFLHGLIGESFEADCALVPSGDRTADALYRRIFEVQAGSSLLLDYDSWRSTDHTTHIKGLADSLRWDSVDGAD